MFSVANTGKMEERVCAGVCVCVCTHRGVCCAVLEESLGTVGDLYLLLLFIVLRLSHKVKNFFCSTHMYTHTLERVSILSLG